MVDVVATAGHRERVSHRHECAIVRVCAGILDTVGSQGRNVALLVSGEDEVVTLAAALAGCQKVFGTGFDPTDGTTRCHSESGDGPLFDGHRCFTAESAAHVRAGDDVDLFRGDPEGSSDTHEVSVWHLSGEPHVAIPVFVEPACDAARLDRAVRLSWVHDLLMHHDFVLELGGVMGDAHTHVHQIDDHVAVREAGRWHFLCAFLGRWGIGEPRLITFDEEMDVAVQRVVVIHDWIERVNIDDHQLGCIDGLLIGFGHDRRDWLADIANLALGVERLCGDCVHHRRKAARRPRRIRGGIHNGHDARSILCFGRIDRQDLAVRHL